MTIGLTPNAALRRLMPALALVLGGCSSYQTDLQYARNRNDEAFKTPPISYQADIVAFMRSYLNDPSRVRGAYVTAPALRTFDNTDRYVSCLRYSARKGDGQYAASKDSLVLYRDGRLDRVIDNARELCKDAAYQPFPELERMAR